MSHWGSCGTTRRGLGRDFGRFRNHRECIRFGKGHVLLNAAADPRVHHEICADWVRSILLLPLFAGTARGRVVEVLSQRAEAFDPVDAEALNLMVLIIGLLFAEGASESCIGASAISGHGGVWLAGVGRGCH